MDFVMLGNLITRIQRFLKWKRCPTDQQLAEYADQQAIGAERHKIERHLAHCDNCLRQIGFMVKTASLQGEPVPAATVQRALLLGAQPPRRTAFPWGWTTVAVGGLAGVLAVVLTWSTRPDVSATSQRQPDSFSEPAAPGTNPETPVIPDVQDKAGAVRGSNGAHSQILLFPQPGQTVARNNLTMRWNAQDKASYYEVQILSEEGDIVWETRCATTSTKLPDSVRLVKGKTYYVRLSVHTDQGGEQKFKAVDFIAN